MEKCFRANRPLVLLLKTSCFDVRRLYSFGEGGCCAGWGVGSSYIARCKDKLRASRGPFNCVFSIDKLASAELFLVTASHPIDVKAAQSQFGSVFLRLPGHLVSLRMCCQNASCLHSGTRKVMLSTSGKCWGSKRFPKQAFPRWGKNKITCCRSRR